MDKSNLYGFKYHKTIFRAGELKIIEDSLTDSPKNLYIVSTPLQLLSAIEAQKHFQTQNNVLVILFFLIRDGRNINQMFKLVKHFPYSKLMTFQNSKRVNLYSFTNYLKELSKYKYEYLFFGYSTPLYRRMVANCSYKKLFFLDDGVHTITTHEQVFNEENEELRKSFSPFPKYKTPKHLFRYYLYAILGYKMDSELEDLNFFTLFDLKSYKNEQIIQHDLSYIRELFFKKSIDDNRVYILGQPLTRAIAMPVNQYIHYLKSIFNYYKDREIYYIPHRVEPISEELIELVSEYQNVKLVKLEESIEFYFMNNNLYPTDVASFITSALFNLKKIYPKSNQTAFEIDLSVLSEFHQNNIELIYENYEKENIEIVRCQGKTEFKKIDWIGSC